MQRRLVSILFAAVLVHQSPAVRAADEAASLATLSLEVQRVEDIRAVRRLQTSYAHYAQFGLWSEMAALFANDAEAIYGADRLTGRAAIEKYLVATWGNGREGLPPGGVHTLLEDAAVLNLSADGKTAKGRWREFFMTGRLGGAARWEQGISQNDYVKEGGVWKISRIDYYRETAGPYETGWVNAGPDVKVIPRHYTSAEAGLPIPPIPEGTPVPALTGTPAVTLAALDRRIQAMNDEDKVANLQNAYGYYVDRKMWDDAVDLFTDDAVLELADVGTYAGTRSIRRFHERSGPQGLRYGELNNRLIFNLLVSVSPAGREARTRGVVFNMLGDYTAGTASLGIDVIENRFVKGPDSIWRIREMRVFPIMATDYYQGWAKSRLVTPPATGQFAPDKPVPAADRGTLTDGVVPDFFLPHAVTGRPVRLPRGTKVAGAAALLPALAAVPDPTHSPRDIDAAIADARRRLSHAVAYIAVDNISHALANDIDDQQWHALGQLFARDGWRAKSAVAFCVGPAHAEECERNYDGVAALPRPAAAGHWLIQPVIDVAPDGTSAKMRHRLLHIDAAPASRGFSDGMYPNNAAKLEDGVWKLDVMAPDQPYFSSPSFADGWARKAIAPVPRPTVKNAIEPQRNFPPDIPRASMPLRHHGSLPGNTIVWPDIKPMWFAYKNPVSGRVPPRYCPDLKTCEKDLAANYVADPAWLKLPEGRTEIGSMHGDVAVSSSGDVYISVEGTVRQRFAILGPNPGLQVYAPDGRFLRNVPNAPFDFHGFVIRRDAEGEFIYGARLAAGPAPADQTRDGLDRQVIVKMTLDGNVVMAIPTSAIPDQFKNKAPEGHTFMRLTGIAIAPNGDIYVTDGYASDYVHRFDNSGKYLASFGGKQPPYGFRTLHKIAIDTRFQPARILGTDRENGRMVHLSLDGQFIGVIAEKMLRPAALAIFGDSVAVGELRGRLSVLDKTGTVVRLLGENTVEEDTNNNRTEPSRWKAGLFTAPHGVAFNPQGDLFVAEFNLFGRVHRLNRQPGQ